MRVEFMSALRNAALRIAEGVCEALAVAPRRAPSVSANSALHARASSCAARDRFEQAGGSDDDDDGVQARRTQ